MARPDHFGDRAGAWNAIGKVLWRKVGDRITYEILSHIRWIRSTGTGNTVCKKEVKVLLAIRDGLDWKQAENMNIEFIQPYSSGGRETEDNVRLAVS